MNNWRLVTDLVAFLPSSSKEKSVLLSAPEKKSYELAVTRQIEGYYDTIHMDENKFELKINKNGILEIKSKQLPESESWYQIKNCETDVLIYKLITQLNVNKGSFDSYEFMAVFNEDFPSDVEFICSEMEEYRQCYEEMRRRTCCEIYSKTKKWIPGHRYDSIKNTYYYLAKVNSTRENETYSSFKAESPTVVYLVVTNLKENEKTVSDVLKNRAIGNEKDDIQILYSIPSMVDSGEELKDDFTGIEEYWKYLTQNTVMAYKTKQPFGYDEINTKKVRFLFDTISLYNDSSKYDGNYMVEPDITVKELLSDITKELVFDCILKYWNLPSFREDLQIGDSKTIDKNIKSLHKLFFSNYIEDPNSLKFDYYENLYGQMNVNIEDIINDELIGWSENIVYSDFDNYLKYIFYTEKRNKSNHVSQQRVKSTNYKLTISTLKDIFGEGPLRESLLKLINYSNHNYGKGVSAYEIISVGTKKEPKDFISCVITVDDLLKFQKGEKGEEIIPENLKYDILTNRFHKLSITYDLGGEIE